MSTVHCIYIFGSNIQLSILYFHKGNTILQDRRFQGILPTNMLASLVNIKSVVANLYINYIADMVCHIQCLHYDQYYNQQQHDQSCQH